MRSAFQLGLVALACCALAVDAGAQNGAQNNAAAPAPANAATSAPTSVTAPASNVAAPAPAGNNAAATPEPIATPAPAPAPATEAEASGEPLPPMPMKKVQWSFEGPFGTYDRAALQRGFQVYKEVCSACHSLKHVAFRNLGDPGGPGFSEAEVKAIAASFQVPAEPDDQGRTHDDSGQRIKRPGTPADYFPSPFDNDKAARAANNGALPPDQSVIVKARKDGPDYVYSILTGYGMKMPATMQLSSPTMNYNPYFSGHQIAMAPPLTEGVVTYADGTKATVDQMAQDVVTFLTWASEPKMEERKQLGFSVMIFLIVLSGLLYLAYRKVWGDAH